MNNEHTQVTRFPTTTDKESTHGQSRQAEEGKEEAEERQEVGFAVLAGVINDAGRQLNSIPAGLMRSLLALPLLVLVSVQALAFAMVLQLHKLVIREK